jgi:hypothetical protein
LVFIVHTSFVRFGVLTSPAAIRSAVVKRAHWTKVSVDAVISITRPPLQPKRRLFGISRFFRATIYGKSERIARESYGGCDMVRSLQGTTAIGLFVVATIAGTIGSTAIADQAVAKRTVQVSGTGTDLLNGAIVHSKMPTATGVIQRGTEIVELSGDLNGKILYHVTTVIDNQKGTLVNTGDQVFSGTIAGSEPVMIHDSKFRFEVNLATGADSGSVYLFDHIAGPDVRCELKVTGTGKSGDGNPTFHYAGTCKFGAG